MCLSSSKVEMGKWIEDLNLAIDMAKKSQEKSSIFLDAGLSDRSNRKLKLILLCERAVTVTTVPVELCATYFRLFYPPS